MKTSIIIFGKYNTESNHSNAGTIIENSIFEEGEYQFFFHAPGVNWGGSVVFVGADDMAFRRNVMRYSYGDGVLLDANKFRTRDIAIEGNVMHDNWGSSLYLHATSHVTVRNNLVFSSATHPVQLDQAGGTHRNWGCIWLQVQETQTYDFLGGQPHTMTNMQVYNNLLMGCSNGITIGGQAPGSKLANSIFYNNTIAQQEEKSILIDTDFTLENVAFNNNIIATDRPASGLTQSGITSTNNMFLGAANPLLSGSDGAGSFYYPPSKFHTAADYRAYADWFLLKDGSPAIDASTNIPAVTFDFYGGARPFGAGVDMGAHEYGSTPDPNFQFPDIPHIGDGSNPDTNNPLQPTPIPPGDINYAELMFPIPTITPGGPPTPTPDSKCDACGYCGVGEKPQDYDTCLVCLYEGGTLDGLQRHEYNWTTVGCIEATTTDFVQTISTIATATIGGISFLLMLYGGYLILTSESDVEKLKTGKKLLVSAISALLIVLFSSIILQLAGVTVLRIPGFG